MIIIEHGSIFVHCRSGFGHPPNIVHMDIAVRVIKPHGYGPHGTSHQTRDRLSRCTGTIRMIQTCHGIMDILFGTFIFFIGIESLSYYTFFPPLRLHWGWGCSVTVIGWGIYYNAEGIVHPLSIINFCIWICTDTYIHSPILFHHDTPNHPPLLINHLGTARSYITRYLKISPAIPRKHIQYDNLSPFIHIRQQMTYFAITSMQEM
mmetsp:Transcript_26450/g.40441  ORF Transcript_26450/g.40441 Transcript_26450/m.40441 type:complete len:206 (+) Transcript_26450:1186-1803(+)